MPRVPTLDQFQVDPGAAPGGRFVPAAFAPSQGFQPGAGQPNPGNLPAPGAFQPSVAQPIGMPNVPAASPDALGIGSRQLQALGQAGEQTGTRLAAIAYDAAKEAENARLLDARNKADAEKLTIEEEMKALPGDQAAGATETLGKKLREKIEGIGANLASDVQKEKFGMIANEIMNQFNARGAAHEAKQLREFSNSTYEGTVANAVNDAALNYGDHQAMNRSLDDIRVATEGQGRLHGMAPQEIDALSRRRTSEALKTAIGAAIQNNDTVAASSMLMNYRNMLAAPDILHLQGVLTKNADVKQGSLAADVVMLTASPQIHTNDFDRAFNILVGTESGGRQFAADGSTLKNVNRNGTADHGIAQVNENTAREAAKLAGLPWDDQKYKNDPQYNAAIGRAYLAKQRSDFGTLDKAYAAYNAGPGALSAAIKKADRAGAPDTWATFLPESTQDYIKKNITAYNTGAGAYQKPTLEDLQSATLNALGPTASPLARRTAIEEVTHRFEVSQKATKQRDQEAEADVIRELMANGGRFSLVPVAKRAALPPDRIDNVMAIGQKIAKGDDSTDLATYNELATNPAAMAKMTDQQFLMKQALLSVDDAKAFAKQRGILLGNAPGGKDGPGDLNMAAINSTIDAQMTMIGLDPKPNPQFRQADAARVGGIRKFITDQIAIAQAGAGKKFSDTEILSKIDDIFLTTDIVKRSLLPDYSKQIVNMEASEIDSKTRAEIVAGFKRAGITSPTDAQIMDIYFKDKMTGAKK